MSMISESPGVGQIEIAEELGLDRSNVANVVERLVTRGWLRQKFSPEDQRKKQITITRNGEKVMEYTDLMLDPSEFRRFGNIDPGDAKVAPLTSGYISLQAESGPLEFRKIELMKLKE